MPLESIDPYVDRIIQYFVNYFIHDPNGIFTLILKHKYILLKINYSQKSGLSTRGSETVIHCNSHLILEDKLLVFEICYHMSNGLTVSYKSGGVCYI